MNNNFYYIWLYGDSLSLPRKNIVEIRQRYLFLLKEFIQDTFQKKVEVVDRAIGGATIIDLKRAYDTDMFYHSETQKDVLIIQAGICDCAPRPIPPYLRDKIDKLKGFIKKMLIFLIKKSRKRIQSNNIYWRTVEESLFENTYFELIKSAKDSFKDIYIINIAPTDNLTDEKSPGFKNSILLYNEIIKKIIEKMNAKNIHLIDVYEYIASKEDIYSYILKEDGHHITPKTHSAYFQLIKDNIKNKIK